MKATKKSTAGMKPASARLSRAETERITRRLRRARAIFKREEIEGVYSRCVKRDWIFRAALAFLTDSGKQTIDRAKKDRDWAVTAAAWSKAADAWLKDMKFRCDLVEIFQRRALIALAYREDMAEIYKAAARPADLSEQEPEAATAGGAA